MGGDDNAHDGGVSQAATGVVEVMWQRTTLMASSAAMIVVAALQEPPGAIPQGHGLSTQQAPKGSRSRALGVHGFRGVSGEGDCVGQE